MECQRLAIILQDSCRRMPVSLFKSGAFLQLTTNVHYNPANIGRWLVGFTKGSLGL
jgi:hypothetical protein